MTFKGFLRICCACLLLASAFIVSTDAQQGTFTLTMTTSGPNSGSVGVRWSSGSQGGNTICNAPLGGGTCGIPGIPAGATVLITANQPGTAGVITDPAVCNFKTTCTFVISADTAAHVGFGDVGGVTFQTFTMQLAGQGEGSTGADNNSCQNFDPLQYSACATQYATGSVVHLTAFRIPNSAFLGFSGGTTPEAQADCNTTNTTCSFALNANASVTATFAQLTAVSVTPSLLQTTNVNGSVNFTAVGTFANGGSFQRNLNPDQGYWKFKAPMATPRFGHAAAALNGRLYVTGGVRNTLGTEFCPPPGTVMNGYCVNANGSVNTTPEASVEAYDPVTNTWSAAPPMLLGARASHAAVVSGSTLYVLGGSTSNNVTIDTVEAFDGTSWSQVASLSSPRRNLGAAALNGIIYAVGGSDVNGNALSTVEAFDTSNPGNGWVARAPLPTARHSLGVVALNGQVYAIGGSPNGNLSVVEAYSPATNTWTVKQSMPSGRSLFGAAGIGNEIYVIGGSGFPGGALAYDAASNQWFNKAFLPQLVQNPGPNQTFQDTARSSLSAAVINGIVYAVGGNVSQPPNLQPPTNIAVPILQAFTDSLVWLSSNIAVATVSQNGQATGRSAGGPVTIAAGVGPLTCLPNNCGSLTVTALPPLSIQVFVSQSGVDAQVGNNSQFTCITFRDPSPNPGPWTATVDFGDGTNVVTIPSNSIGTPQQICGFSAGSANGAFQLSHNYANAGDPTAHITVNGQGGITGSNNLVVHVHPQQPPPQECAHVTLTVTGTNFPNPTVPIRILDRSVVPPVQIGEDDVPLGVNTFSAPEGSFRIEFVPPAGYVATPPYLDLDPHCGDQLTFSVQLGPADVTAPVTTAAGTPAANGAGWNTGNVAVAMNATDNAGGSGVANITYSVAGAQSQAATVVNGNSAGVTITASGTSTVTFFATDNAGNAETPKTFVVKIDRTAPVLSASPSSATLPRNGKMMPVVVSGTVADAQSGILAGSPSFQVVDEYGTVQPSGPVSVAPNGSYSFTVMLEASRLGNDQDGRRYEIVVTASNNAGLSASASAVVTVPHDQGN